MSFHYGKKRQNKQFHGPRSGIKPSKIKANSFVLSSKFLGLKGSTKEKKKRLCLSVENGGDSITTDTTQNSSENAEKSFSDKNKPVLKRTPLTAREKLRAARVLSRYNETKAAKTQLGSKVLEALRESDKKERKRSGLPAAPTNMLDDSKRGMPKAGLTWELPAGFDVTLIISSFVLISTLMFATTYFVWKVGAIHFNEY